MRRRAAARRRRAEGPGLRQPRRRPSPCNAAGGREGARGRAAPGAPRNFAPNFSGCIKDKCRRAGGGEGGERRSEGSPDLCFLTDAVMRTHHFRSEVIYLARNFKVRSCSLYLSTCPYCCPRPFFSVTKSHSKLFILHESHAVLFCILFPFCVCACLKQRVHAKQELCTLCSLIALSTSRGAALCTPRAAPSTGGPSPALPAPLRLRCRAPAVPGLGQTGNANASASPALQKQERNCWEKEGNDALLGITWSLRCSGVSPAWFPAAHLSHVFMPLPAIAEIVREFCTKMIFGFKLFTFSIPGYD